MSRALEIDRIFDAALDLPEADREAFVRESSGSDTRLYEEVLALLKAAAAPDDQIESRFEQIRNRAWQNLVSREGSTEENLAGTVVGPWLIEQSLARGGLSTVYLARRNDGAYTQKVALKALRRGLDTDDVVRRFHAEREILSSLQHASISRILDGGALPDGRPYLVLDYVKGVPITRYCEEQHLGIRARATLMIDVARAIAHAHRRLVIHRDIKPGNILVNEQGRVSLLDFGIAKILDPHIVTDLPQTRTGLRLLTPAYASPEQLSEATVTTASDIYQMGLVLYELLTGEQPLAEPGLERRLPLPSTTRSGPGRNKLRGDLDAIVRKAAHSDPDRRYTSADQMADDIQRYLDGKPIEARPDTLGYRLRKLQGRKPWLLPVVAIGIMTVAAFLVTQAMYAERLAKEKAVSDATATFLLDLFSAPNPFDPADAALGKEITVVEALDIGMRRARSDLANQPELQASLLRVISEVYASLDKLETAIELREGVLEFEQEQFGEQSPEAIRSLRALGSHYNGMDQVEKGTRLLDRQLEMARQVYPPDHPELALSELRSGTFAVRNGDLKGGAAFLQAGLERLRPRRHEYARQFINAQIVFVEQMGMEDLKDALERLDESQQLALEVFGEDSLQAAQVQVRLASTLTNYGDPEGSERNFLAAIPVLEAKLGPNHSSTLSAINNLGYQYSRRGDEVKAEALFRDLLERQLAKNGRLSRGVADTYQNLAGSITGQKRYDESIPLHREAYEIYKEVAGDGNYIVAFPLLTIAYAELMRENPEVAEASAWEALERLKATIPGTFVEGVAQCLVGLSLEQQGRVAEGSDMVDSAKPLMATGSIPDPYPEICRLND